jgi:4-amino-4-deoxy-L-arabinose transferase-like glycosyltransferase
VRRGLEAARAALAALGGRPGLVALIALAALLRFPTLDVQSFWRDEAVIAAEVIRPGLTDTLEIAPATGVDPPFYYLVVWVWSTLFGTGEVGLRSLSALAGTAVVPVAYAAGLTASSRVALVAAALTATNPMLVWYSQEVGPYALVVFLAGLSFLFFLAARSRPGRRPLVGWVICSALAVVTHYSAILVVAPEAAWLLARSGERRRKLVAVGATAAATLAVVPLALEQAHMGRAGWIATVQLSERLRDLGENFLVGGGPVQVDWLVTPAAALATAGLVLLAVRTERAERELGVVALAVGALAVALALAMAALGVDYLLDRNLLPALLPMTLAVAAGFGARGAGPAGAVAAAALCAAFTLIVALTATSKELQRPDWRGAAAALGDTARARVIVVPAHGTHALEIYRPAARDLRTGGQAPANVDPQRELVEGRYPPALPTSVREVAMIGPGEPDSLTLSLPPGFTRSGERAVGSLGIAVFRAPQPVDLIRWAVSTTAVAPPSGAAVLIERPRPATTAD